MKVIKMYIITHKIMNIIIIIINAKDAKNVHMNICFANAAS